LTIDLLRMVSDQLKGGSPLPFGIRDEQGKLLLAKGRVVANEAQLGILLSRGIYVDHDQSGADEEAAGPEAAKRRTTLFDLWKQITARLDGLLNSLDKPGFAERCDTFAGMLAGLIERDADIAIYHSVRQDPNSLSLYGPRARESFVHARYATLGKLNDTQREQIRAHPQQAVDGLQAAGVTDADWLQAVLQHHERPGGGGYPHNLATTGEMAAVLRMADVFMAKISPRTERPALPILDAARQMFAQSQGNPLAAAIIKEYGICPPGNFVLLASGEMAVVIRRGATAHTPTAAAVTDHNGIPIVRTPRRNTADAKYAIKSSVPESKMLLRVPPERLYGLVEE